MFGADAMALMSRKPELTFAKAYRMLGMYALYVRTVRVFCTYVFVEDILRFFLSVASDACCSSCIT